MGKQGAPIECRIPDIDGNMHEYTITPHKGMEAVNLVWKIIRLCAGPLGNILDSNADKFFAALKDEHVHELGDVLGNEENGGPPNIFRDAADHVLEIIFEVGTEQLTEDLFMYVNRDGEYMNKRSKFDSAYQANVTEVFHVYKKVLEVNRFLELFRTFTTNIEEVREETPTQVVRPKNVSSPERAEA